VIQRVESGWVQVNDTLSKQHRRFRRRLPKPRDREDEEERVYELRSEKATIDLVA
jgi:hypothetical protein